ncbi:MAG: glycosyltransferase family 1 protein, partial [Chloroflexi bacterium]
MHVAINAFFWNQVNSGSGQYTRQLVYHLNRFVSDLDITLVYPQIPGGSEPETVPPSVHVKTVSVRPGNIGKVLFEQRHFPRACREIGADIAHVPYWGGPLQSPIPLVVTVHDLTTMLVPEYRQPLPTRLYNALVTTSAQSANHIITDSLASKQDIMQHLGIPDE